ncbi:hypothetical protein Vadar_031462 [Vaccinium darrowii]|nr:hypothetical protein Vadar_031462 [Vaccinium darrowii]
MAVDHHHKGINLCNSNSVQTLGVTNVPSASSHPMEASVRFLNPFFLKYPRYKIPRNPVPHPSSTRIVAISTNPHFPNLFPSSSLPPPPPSSFSHPNSSSLGFFQSLSTNSTSHPFVADSTGHKSSFRWHLAVNGNGGGVGVVGGKGPVVTVVLLGWLGSKPRHLKQYVELYNARGMHAVTFVASVNDVLASDMGKKLEEKMYAMAGELGSWLDETEKDGRQRLLLFHTFSNTGWLA